MKITYDPEADSLYIYFSKKKIKRTVEVSSRVFVDLDAQGNIRGIEMLFVSKTIFPEAVKEIILHSSPMGDLVVKLPVMTVEEMIKPKEKVSRR